MCRQALAPTQQRGHVGVGSPLDVIVDYTPRDLIKLIEDDVPLRPPRRVLRVGHHFPFPIEAKSKIVFPSTRRTPAQATLQPARSENPDLARERGGRQSGATPPPARPRRGASWARGLIVRMTAVFTAVAESLRMTSSPGILDP